VTVTAIRKDPHRLTMTIEAEFDASPERVWQLWADPGQLERWWGPPIFPATVTQHNLAPAGRVEYGMMGPRATGTAGTWRSWRPKRRTDSCSATGWRAQTVRHRHAAGHDACHDRGGRRRAYAHGRYHFDLDRMRQRGRSTSRHRPGQQL
jgi:uncharacterized protein YndB with AHSA1/START domain